MAERFFNGQKISALNEKTIHRLTAPADSFDHKMVFSAQRVKAIFDHVHAVGNMIGERCLQLFDAHQEHLDSMRMRLERLEKIMDREEGDPLPVNVLDQISQNQVQIDKLRQQLSALTKYVTSLEKKI